MTESDRKRHGKADRLTEIKRNDKHMEREGEKKDQFLTQGLGISSKHANKN